MKPVMNYENVDDFSFQQSKQLSYPSRLPKQGHE